jgi:hypothetical protein
VLRQLLHIHLEHNVKTILLLSHVNDGLHHLLCKDLNVILLFEILLNASHDVLLKHLAFSRK